MFFECNFDAPRIKKFFDDYAESIADNYARDKRDVLDFLGLNSQFQSK